MAKQTFTTGQVLTAAQMTSLQQTAMLGGDTTAKTASYVLVAADAGTTVAMNAAGSTTITVNTGLFSAGDIVFIQNRGAGACTVTAGTATVACAGSLILPQNDAGILYFTSASAAIFYDFIQTGATSPLTTKGDLYTYSTSDARLPVGTNGYTLVADSAEATGLKWAAPAGGGKVLQVVSATYSTQVDLSSATYTDTGLTASITPTLNTSKVLILVYQGSMYKGPSGNDNNIGLRLLRGSTVLVTQSSLGTFVNEFQVMQGNFSYLDNPATTSSTTYKTQFARANGTTGSVGVQYNDLPSSIILLEIGA
jgi:hypothetical protein